MKILQIIQIFNILLKFCSKSHFEVILTDRLDGITPATKILKISHAKEKAVYLASETIKGKNLHKVLNEEPGLIIEINMDHYSSAIIASLLTSPGDAKPDNFILTEDRKIVSIDNDLAFYRGKLGKGQKISEVKEVKLSSEILNVLYFFPQMDEPVSKTLRTELITKSPEEIISSWLKALYQYNQNYENLIKPAALGFLPKSMSGKVLEKNFQEEDLSRVNLPIKLREKTAVKIYRKLDGIINLLKDHETITHNSLFKKFYPGVSYLYADIRKNTKDPLTAIKHLYAAIASDPELTKTLTGDDILNSNIALKSASKLVGENNMSEFKKIFTSEIVREAEDFMASIDFSQSRFNKENAIFKILQENLYFVRELTLHNINGGQLKSLLLSHEKGEESAGKFNQLKGIKLINNHKVDQASLSKIEQVLQIKIEQQHYTKYKAKEADIGKVQNVSTTDELFNLLKANKKVTKEILLEILVRNNIDINELKEDGNAILHQAVKVGNTRIVRLLLDSGANENLKNDEGKTAMDLARGKKAKLCEKVIADHQPKYFWEALINGDGRVAAQLAKSMSKEKLERLVENKLLVVTKEALDIALSDVKLAEVAFELVRKIDNKYLLKNYNDNDDTALHLLVRNYSDGDIGISVIKEILKYCPKLVQRSNKQGQYAADIAQEEGKLEFLVSLLNSNCDLSNFRDQNEEIAYKAAKYGIKIDKRDLSEYDYKKQDENGDTLLSLCAKNKDFDLYTKIRDQYKEELTELYNENNCHKLACDEDTTEVSRIYKQFGWDITEEEAITGKINLNKINKLGNSLLYELIKSYKMEDIEKYKAIEKIIESKADVNYTERTNLFSPLHLAVSSNQKKYVELLIDSRANTKKEDNNHRSPLDIAREYKHTEIAEILGMYLSGADADING